MNIYFPRCTDICEDPEIRERIEQLRTEQESKKLAEQKKRVRRSQSNNTRWVVGCLRKKYQGKNIKRLFYLFNYRAQSVRRTSLRDKTLTTKKDAVEETKLRLQAQEVSLMTFFFIRWFGCLEWNGDVV